MRTREKVKASSPQLDWNNYSMASNSKDSPLRRASDSENQNSYWTTNVYAPHPGIAELPAISTVATASAPTTAKSPLTSSSLQYPPDMPALNTSTAPAPKSQPYPTTQPFPSSMPMRSNLPLNLKPKDSVLPKQPNDSQKRRQPETSATKKKAEASTGDEGRPVTMSRTQREKDRKKRSKAAVLMEHVDIIKDEFWEKRPWILTGKTG